MAGYEAIVSVLAQTGPISGHATAMLPIETLVSTLHTAVFEPNSWNIICVCDVRSMQEGSGRRTPQKAVAPLTFAAG